MATEINAKKRCVIIAGAPCGDAAFVRETVRGGDFVICADRGFQTALAAEVAPDLLVGDFDSCTAALPDGVPVVRLKPEKDFSDALHAACEALGRGFREIVLIAATGGRLDHTLANLSVLEYLRENGAEGIILSRNESIRVLPEGEYAFASCRGLTFSVFPFGCESVTLSYSGAKYPLSRGTLSHALAVGLSNIFVENEASVTVHAGTALMITEREV